MAARLSRAGLPVPDGWAGHRRGPGVESSDEESDDEVGNEKIVKPGMDGDKARDGGNLAVEEGSGGGLATMEANGNDGIGFGHGVRAGSAAVEANGIDGSCFGAGGGDGGEANLGESGSEECSEGAQDWGLEDIEEAKARRTEVSDSEEGGDGPCKGMALPVGPHRVVHVTRPPEVEEARMGLPVVGVEQEFMEAVTHNDVVVVCGQTGSGKTTQVPQFLYEAGYGCRDFHERGGAIGITQPRRVAATSTAKRVAHELGTQVGDLVGYQVRHDRCVGTGTAIKFMTDGILMRELQHDFLLRKYSVLVVDEAHERSLNTDLLLGMLSRIVPLRRKLATGASVEGNVDSEVGKVSDGKEDITPLKLIVMSATLCIEDFTANTRLFPTAPPVINVSARQYPVTVHFSKKTEMVDYVSAAFRKVCRIHRELPAGGILVFLTGQREVEHMCERLRRAFSSKGRASAGRDRGKAQNSGPGGVFKDEMRDRNEDEASGGGNNGNSQSLEPVGASKDEVELEGEGEKDSSSDGSDFEAEQYGADAVEALRGRGVGDHWGGDVEDDVDDYESNEEEDEDEEKVQILGGEDVTPEEVTALEKAFEERFGLQAAGEAISEARHKPVTVLPLYGLLPASKQAKVFESRSDGSRLIVVATNVAETSITIPGIRYVVDSGRSKQKILEPGGGSARFEVRWVSKAAADQRAGRAGRTVPGHTYRLYSSAHFNDTFPQHTPPEVLNTPLEGVVLLMKSIGVNKVVNFPFPTPPDETALASAERALTALCALDPGKGRITELGRKMLAYPLSPRHSRMILEASKLDGETGGQVMTYAIALAAAMSDESPFVHIESIGQEGGVQAGVTPAQAQLQAAEKRKHARALHEQFRCEDSDAVGALRALCAYERAGCREDFCRRNFMHSRTLHEMAALHRQLMRDLLRQRLPGSEGLMGDAVGGTGLTNLMAKGIGLKDPAGRILICLKKAIAAGWCDRVARRVRSVEYLKRLREEGRAVRAVRYQSCGVEDLIYMHPRSMLRHRVPEFVVYTEVLSSKKRPYMSWVTAVDPSWLPEIGTPLCGLSEPLDDPAPFYTPQRDAVMCYRTPKYGRLEWELPPMACPHPDPEQRACHFAVALLQGRVVGGTGLFSGNLVVPAAMATRPETRFHGQLGRLVEQLARHRVGSLKGLRERWAVEPAFLKEELRQWLRKQCRGMLDGLWGSWTHNLA
ncbi:unnamed protein product [Ostreobium quekettii]|uniref:RNA helicase n=1 Tax=Ostreobium quekettii TaxID=121088 RepID=A0A8S1J4G4_9CHLO|nr:unnamed protein product [Ostreobium quekettii]|eukprot:evm.model.scf_266.2 EVM.evm.TU.scf_266.2   scf_266:79386-83973(+)